VPELHQRLGAGAVAIAHMLRVRDDLSVANNRVHEILQEYAHVIQTPIPILEVITDHGSEFINPHQDERPCLDHTFEGYLDENDIKHTLCKVGRPQSNGKIERFLQTYDKHRWRLGTLSEFLAFYNEAPVGKIVQFSPLLQRQVG
jgi:transposase InsO family protein